MSDLTLIQYEDMEIVFDGTRPMLTQAQMAQLFGIKRDSVSDALRRAQERGLIDLDSVSRYLRVTATDGKTYNVKHYDMHAVAIVGFRVNEATPRVIAFQKWVASLIDREINQLIQERDSARSERDHAILELTETARQLRSTADQLTDAKSDANDALVQLYQSLYPEFFEDDDDN